MEPIEEEDDDVGPRRRGGGRGGPTDVTFSVFVHPPPAIGESVCLSGTIAELQNPLQMQPNQTGDRRLWHLTVQINAASIVPPPAQQAPAAMIGLMMAGSVLGGGRGAAAAPTFEYSYTVQDGEGKTVRSEEGPRSGEQGELKQLYYHKANFGGPEAVQDEGFKLFIHDEIFQLQSGQITTRDFHRRMVALAASSFNKKRSLLDKALEDLINHWGMDNPAPAQVVLAVAAAMGTMKRNTQGAAMYGFDGFDTDYAGFSSSSFPSKKDEKEKEEPPSLIVCRWVVKHCPSRADVEEEQRGERDRGERGRESRSLATTQGVRLAAETLYKEEQTFDWLKLLNFLPEHSLPQPVNASQCSKEEARKLTESFFASMHHVFQDFQRSKEQFDTNPPADAKDRQKAEQEMQQRMELFLRGLCTFCPSIECMKTLVLHLRANWEPLQQIMIPMIFSRFRSIHFGKDDKEKLQEMIREIPFMICDETAIALLQNQNHPSEAFREREIANFVNLVTHEQRGVRAAGPQLQNAARRWLVRYYGRPVDRPMERKEDKASVNEMSRNEYQMIKRDIREAMRNAMQGWQLILELACFKVEEDTVRNLLFELSQSYFFKDQDPLLVLDCILDLEKDAEQMKIGMPLQDEIRRIATKSVRDAQEASESDIDSNLLQLLFDTPTRLRYFIIENFITLRSAATGLRQLLVNYSIWTLLLSKKWLNAPGISELPLYHTQQAGMKLLTTSAKQLEKGTINLEALHTIIRYRDKYEPLVEQVATRPTNIQESKQKLDLFDTEYKQLRQYLIRFCKPVEIEAAALSDQVEEIRKNYELMELNVAAAKFTGLKVREHLPWLYQLNSSEVFSGIWKQTARPEGASSERIIDQEEVVNSLIPAARKTWEDLAKSIETGEAILKDIKWVVEFTMQQVVFELKLLEATAPKAKSWVNEATELCKSMRLAAKLRLWAPSMLHLRNHSLQSIFKENTKDDCVEILNKVVCEYEHMWTKILGDMTVSVTPFKDTINKLSEAMQDYTITAAKHDESLKWLLGRSSTEDFNLLLSLCTPNTDDPIILAAIASLKQMRTFLAEALFTKPPYAGLQQFIEELAKLNVDTAEQQCLESVQKSFDPLLELLTTHSRTPGVQACYDLKKIHLTGTFHVKCALTESAQLKCCFKESQIDYEALAELRRQLLMTDVPYELDGAKDLPAMLDTLVQKLQLLEDFGKCTMELYRLGHFAYHLNDEVLVVPPEDTVKSVADRLEGQQRQLEDWQQAVSDARSKHYFLNYYTVRELSYLSELLPKVDTDPEWNHVWPMLQCVDLQVDEQQTRQKIMKQLKGDLALLRTSSGEPDREVKLLNDVGQMLGDLFRGTPPQVRPLEGLTEVKQQLQGDLLIRSMQNKEQGIPIFVCCADEACKVTELVLSIYTRRERVPEAEELLLCSSHTTLEEIELLLRRFFHARKHQREDRLYCVGNVHLLPYVTQCGTVEALRKMEEQFGFEHASALVFASGMPNQMLLNALNRHNLAVSILQQDLLKNAVSMVGEKYHGRQMEAVTAQMNGVGKTHYIYKQIYNLQAQYGGKPLLHHVEIRETTDISALVSNLLSDPTDPETPTAVHINLAHILPSHVDTLLFELLIVGMLRDTHLCKVYHRRAKDFFFVEIPNTPGESTAKQLSFCLILPRVFLQMSADRMEKEMPVLKPCPEVPGALQITFEENILLRYVGMTLLAMKKEAFNPKSKDFNVGWTGAKAIKEVDTDQDFCERTYTLLEEVSSSPTSPPSFLVFMNLVKFLGNLIKSAEEWNMMNLALLQNFDPGLKHFKHCFFKLLIETSRDFALRQVPKAMDMTAPSVLAPPVMAPGLGRGVSRGSDANMPPELLRNLSGMSGPPSLTRKTSGQRKPALQRNQSRAEQEMAAQNEADAKAEQHGVGRIEASAYCNRFDQMPSWENCEHPVANFKKNDRGNIIGCNIMSLQPNFIGKHIDRNLQNSLNLNDLKLDRDWSKVTHQEAVALVHQIEGGTLLAKKDHLSGPKEYVVTVDNLIKIMSIQQRLKFGLPVILMGETGCGKTALVKFLAETLEFPLFTLDIHGGITDAKIIGFLEDAIEKAGHEKGVLVFFDEINAANCMALFKTIIIDRIYGNKVIPENVRIISCCNPYRKRLNKELEDVALVYNAAAGDAASGISDPMKELVYRVHPLPESLIDVVSDFGSLSEASEELYIKAILRKELPNKNAPPPVEPPAPPPGAAAQAAQAVEPLRGAVMDDYEVFINAFCDLLCASQQFVREANAGERSVVSMRDIGRAARVFKWFCTSYSRLKGEAASAAVKDDKDGLFKIEVSSKFREHLRRALVLTLGYCYHAQLDRSKRWDYRNKLCETWQIMRKKDEEAMEWLSFVSEAELNKILIDTSFDFVSQMDLGEGIALNEALRENLFMLLVSVMNHIPILLIGKPGCSKSLAMGVLQSNLNGEVSSRDFFKAMPAVDVFAYQCSPLSTPDAILNAFHSARQSNLGHKSTIVCVLLDEVGLAEESPHLPLKVLHKELEDLRGISCVGISNWALDAAKMSRCVTLYRPPPTVADLRDTAQGMVQSENLKSYLNALSEAFSEIYKCQKRKDFWGMREFYSTVRVINSELKRRAAEGKEAVLEKKVLMKTVQRNFGGRPQEEMKVCIEEFFDRTGMAEGGDDVEQFATSELIRQNLEEPDARHLMLLTKNNAALRLLFEGGLLDHSRAEVMFGSTFPSDLSDMFVAMQLQRIKSFMQQPVSLVMVHCDALYESLYDLLNQHYMEYAGQRYVRIAHGSKAKQCPIHKLFRVIVVTELSDAYFKLAPPLLNRFEKQIFLRKDLMTKADEALLARVNKFWHTLNEMMNAGKTVKEDDDALEEAMEHPNGTMLNTASHRPIAGYHPELLSSLVFTLRKAHADKTLDELMELAKRALTWVLTPEAVCITAATLQPKEMQIKFGFDIVSEYFEKQRHSDLPSFAEMTVENKDFWCDEYGGQTMVMTYSPIRGKVGSELGKVKEKGLVARAEVSLHELSSSTDIEKAVQDFYNLQDTSESRNFLIIHADPVAASVRMIEHCRFVCEKARNSFVLKGKGTPGSMFVVLVVHLQRGYDGKFSFDFDSQWSAVFLDSVEPSADLSSMPSLGAMLHMPLIDVVKGLEFSKLLRSCFRSSLSRLMYPHSRRPDDLQRQIQLMLKYIEDVDFVTMIRDWVLHVLQSTPKNMNKPEEGSVGEDRHWFAAIASAAQELALAGTFRAALHGRVVILVGSLLSALLAHLERNSGLELLDIPSKRDHWLKLCTASLLSVLSARLQSEAISALTESATAQHEVGTDAYTSARPFSSRFPASWFISKVIDGVRHIIEQNDAREQLAALQSQYQLSKLAEIGINHEMPPEMLEDYMSDFTAMHLDWTERIDRGIQLRILKKTLTRLRQQQLTSILEVHQLFWSLEKELTFSVSLLNAVPQAVPQAEELIEKADLNSLYYDLLLLVHRTLALELVELNSMRPEKSQELYRGWLMRKLVVAGLTKDKLMSGGLQGVDPKKITELKSNTEPRMETLSLVLQHVAYPLELAPEVVRDFAKDLPQERIRYSGTLLAMLKFGQVVVNKNPDQKEKCLQALSSFVESWFLDVCLRDAEAMSDLEPASLRVVCSVAAGLPTLQAQSISGLAGASLEGWSENMDSGIAQLAEGLYVPRSSCLNLALLRKLIVSSDGVAKDQAIKHIEELLKVVADHEKHNDTLFATRYAILQEEDKDQPHGKCKYEDPEHWPDLQLPHIFGSEVKSNTAKMLRLVGQCRCILHMYAQILVQDPIDHDLHALAVPKVDGLLKTHHPGFRSVCRSMRLYLLKCMERVRGLSFVRGTLAEEPLSETSWVKEWRDLHDIDFEKFIGAALVPKWNPFLGEDQDLKEYREATVAVMELMTTTSTAKLTKYAQDIGQLPEEKRRRHVGGLLLAVCQEPGLLAALEEPNHRPPWRPMLCDWLANSNDLKVTDKERMLLRIFSGDDSPIQDLPDKKWLETFVTYGGRKMDDLLRWRVLGHLAAVLIAAPETSLLHSLRVLMLEPEKMKSFPPFLPAMDEDIRSRVLKALVERGENIWKFKSHWWKCSCGFTFFIGECGRPMEVAKCPGCGLPIGGRDHNQTEHTVQDDESDRSPWGYVLPPAEKDEKHVTFREVQSSSARAIRLLLHGSMYLGVIAAAKPGTDTPHPRVFEHLSNESVCTLRDNPEAQYLGQHFSNDWKSMVEILSSNTEDLAVGLHNLLLTMSATEKDEPLKPLEGSVDIKWGVLTLPQRNSWEETIEARYLKTAIKNLDDSLQDLYKKWGGDQEDGKFVAELKEAADVKDFPPNMREAQMPLLWAYRSPVTLDALHKKIGMESNTKEQFPVLCTVLQNPLISILPALGTLVGVFEWQALCINQFSGRITKAQAGERTVSDVLDSVPRNAAEKRQWTQAFKNFQRAWKLAMPYCEYECLQISETMREYELTMEDSMLWCIPDHKDEGMYALAVIDWLVAQHNELVQIVAGTLGYPARKVSSRLLVQHDVIKYNKKELMRFLSNRCATWGVGGRLNLDLKQVESHLRRELSRPEITLQMRGFQWLGDTHAAGNELKTVITQKDLSLDIIEQLKRDIPSPALANACLQKVQMSIAFILKSGSTLGTEKSGEMLLSDYMKNVLAESPESFMPSCASKAVHLWHMDSFVKVLKQIVNKDPVDSMDPKYKEELPAELKHELLEAKEKLPDQLVDVLGTFGEARLTETYIGVDYEILVILQSVRDQLEINDEIFEEIERWLPGNLKMKHWAAVYKILRD